MYHHNFRADPKLPIGQIAVRRFPCACDACITQLKEPWLPSQPFYKQSRYKPGNTKCMYWHIFQGLNDWLLIRLVDSKCSDTQVDELHSIMDNTLLCNAMYVANAVFVNGYGALATDDNSVKVGYYILKWTSCPYHLQKDITVDTFDPPMVLHAGDVVCEAVYLNPVFFTKFIYTHSDAKDMSTIVLLKHVVDSNIDIKLIRNKDDLPQGMKRHYGQIENKNAILLSEVTHQNILDEIERRNNMDII